MDYTISIVEGDSLYLALDYVKLYTNFPMSYLPTRTESSFEQSGGAGMWQ